MAVLTVIQYNPSQERREQEREAARARSHAARVSHYQKRLERRRRASTQLQRLGPQNVGVITNSPSVTTAFEGNSDPFQCFDIKITPELNRLIAFTRDVVIPARYMPFAVRKMSGSSSRPGTFANSSIIRAWTDVSGSLYDEGIALARLTTYCQIMSICLPDPTQFENLAMEMRTRSIRLLMKKLQKQTASSLTEEMGNLKGHTFGLFDVECHNGNLDAAIVHGTALKKLLHENNKVDVSMSMRLLYMICHAAASTGQRTLPDVSDWITGRLEGFLTEMFPVLPFGRPQDDLLHPTITSPELRNVFARRRYLGDACIRRSQRDEVGTGNDDMAYLYVAVSSLIDMSRLNNMYHDLVEAGMMAGNRSCETYTQAAMSVALNYLARRMYGDLTINGIDLRDFSAVSETQLKTALRLAFEHSTSEDSLRFAPAYLWILYAGALCEHRKEGFKPSVISLGTEWFSPLLARHAQNMGVQTWTHVRRIAEQFLYVNFIEPDGETWFEDLLVPYNCGVIGSEMSTVSCYYRSAKLGNSR